MVELDAGVVPIRMLYTSAGVRMQERDYQVLINLEKERRLNQARHRAKVGASLEVLQRHRLPLYWNHAWRAEKYEETRSFNVLAERYRREVQGARGVSISAFDHNYFKRRQQEGDPLEEWRRTQRDEFADYYEAHHQTVSQTLMADRFRVTDSTVSRWIRELSRIYRAAAQQPELAENPQLLKDFATTHNVDPRIVRRWLQSDTPAFTRTLVPQPKEKYYSRSKYRSLFRRFEKRYFEAGGKLQQNQVARDLGVDRSTIRQWIRRIEKTDSSDKP